MLESISLWLATTRRIVDQATSSLMIWGPHHMVSVTLLLFTVNLYCHGVLKNETTVEYNRVDGQTVVE